MTKQNFPLTSLTTGRYSKSSPSFSSLFLHILFQIYHPDACMGVGSGSKKEGTVVIGVWYLCGTG